MTHLDVALISMPFGIVDRPSIALGLLEASLDEPSCRTFYFNLRFAELTNLDLYAWLSSGSPVPSPFLGEYVFRPALFPDAEWDPEGFLQRCPIERDALPSVPADLVRQLDAMHCQVEPFLDECAEEILRRRPRIVGFTSVFQQQLASLALARRLKEADDELFVVFGGPNCEGVMGREMIRQFDFVDAAVSGEGEVVFPEMVRRVLRGDGVEDLAGVSSAVDRRSPRRPITHARRLPRMDDLPVPEYDEYFDTLASSSLHGRLEPGLFYETSRGCWWGEKEHCTFCGLNGAGMAFRSKSGERALAELRTLLEEYPVSQVQVVDNILDMKYFRTFLPALAEEEWDVELFYEVKANLTKDHLRLLAAAGITEIQPGIESLSSHVLHAMGKGVSMLQNLRLLKWCQEVGLRAFWNVIWGFPKERPEDYAELAGRVPWLHHLTPPVRAGAIRLDRFSPNFEKSEEFGFVDVRPDPGYGELYPFAEEALANLAYSFGFTYGDRRDVASYTEVAYEAIDRWRDEHVAGSLFYFEKGESLWIWDRRPAAASSLTILDGVDRQLYLACDDIRSLAQLRRLADEGATGPADAEALEARLQGWVDRGLMAREDDKYLSLAIRRDLEAAARAA